MREIHSYEKFINRFPDKTIMVIGDLMIDRYIEGDVTRISPEAPVPVIKLNGKEQNIFGGAGNVYNNLIGLGCNDVRLIGVVGSDDDGIFIRDHIDSINLWSHGIIFDESRPTIVKTRIIAQQQQLTRMDRESTKSIEGNVRTTLKKRIYEQIYSNEIDGIIISDYEKGLLDEDIIEYVQDLAIRRGIPTFVDPKKDNFKYYKRCTVVMPNRTEAYNYTDTVVTDIQSAIWSATTIRNWLQCKNIVLKMGECGMLLLNWDETYSIKSIKRQVFDVIGAGDTAIAAFALAYVSGARLEESTVIANESAGIVVSEHRTTSITSDKLKKSLLLDNTERIHVICEDTKKER